MNLDEIKKELFSVDFNDETGIVMLRYILSNILAKYVEEYKRIFNTGEALRLLQAHRKLEDIYTNYKEKYRSNTLLQGDFSRARTKALESLGDLSYSHAHISAA